MNLAEFLIQCVDQYGDRTAIRFEPDRGPATALTYRQIATSAAFVATELMEAGLREGNCVGMVFPNTPDFAASFLGIVLAGGIAAPIHPSHSGPQVRARIQAIDAAVALVPKGRGAEHSDLALRHGVLEIDPPRDKVALKAPKREHVTDAEVACCLFTSSNATPVLLSHRNLIAAVDGAIHAIEGEPPVSRVLCPIPFDGVYGLSALLVSMRMGAELVTGFGFTSDRALELIAKHKIDTVLGVPWHYSELLGFDRRVDYDTSSVVRWISAGAPLFDPVLQDFEKAYACRLRSALGMTEASGMLALSPPRRRLGSVGKPILGVAVRIHDEDDRPVVDGVVGEIVAKGPTVMHGYVDQQLTQEVMGHGWLHTGDMGYRDSDGFIYLIGRKENYYICQGVGVYPREIEEVIIAMRGVRDVCVLGRPTSAEICTSHAFVVLRPQASVSAAQVQDACRERFSPPRVPDVVTFLDMLPYSERGKIDRAKLAAME